MGDLAAVIAGRENVFLSAAVIGSDKGSGGAGRTNDTDATQLTALWVDLEREGEPGHRTEGPHWTRDDIRRLLDHLHIKPTAIVDSGGGWWLYFLLDTPVPLNEDGTGELLLDRWRNYWETIQDTFKLSVDLSVFTASRIVRAPGSINNKENTPRPAVVKSLYPDHRYTQADLEAFLPYPKPDPTPTYDWNADKAGERPGDVYNRQATQESTVSLLLAKGFHSPKRVGGRVDLTRPSKNGRDGSSVSVYPDGGGQDLLGARRAYSGSRDEGCGNGCRLGVHQ